MHLPPTELHRGLTVQVDIWLAVSDHHHLLVTFQMAPPLLQRSHHNQQLLLAAAVVALCRAELTAVESHWPLILQQHSITAKTAGIHQNFKGQIKIRQCKHRCRNKASTAASSHRKSSN